MKYKKYAQDNANRNFLNLRDSNERDQDYNGYSSDPDFFGNRGRSNYGSSLDDGRIQMDRGNNYSNFRNDYSGLSDYSNPYRYRNFHQNSSQGWSPASDIHDSLWQSTKNFFGKGPKGFRRSDEKIREEVCEALYRDNLVDASEIEVSVKDAEVILSGTVSGRRMKRLAEDCADSVSGVSDVRNEIRVQPLSEKTYSADGTSVG
ncbi:MAG: BON domain-containing protein, partial [Bdellovibrionaceae bacterium]|nr:BON domain-containing protein [Pseudobdellovibrionaceae bacterium]